MSKPKTLPAGCLYPPGIRPGDEIRIDHVLGCYPDGQFMVDETAPVECWAVWRMRWDASLVLVSPGKQHNDGAAQYPAGYNIGGK